MTSSNASPRARSTARGLSLVLGTWTPAALGCAVVLLAGVHRAAAGINVWTSLGPEGGHVSTLAIDPSKPSTLYAGTNGGVFKSTDAGAGTDYGGVFTSTDAGATWAAANSGLDIRPVSTLAIDPATPSTLYAGMGYCGFACPSGIVSKSMDGGATWNTASTGLPYYSDYVAALAIDPGTPSTLYAATGGGVFKSTDAGDTWNDSSGCPFDGTGLPLFGDSTSSLVIDPATVGSALDAG